MINITRNLYKLFLSVENGNIYSTVFTNNTFDNSGEVASSRSRKGSQAGSGVIYVYDGMKGMPKKKDINIV